MFISILIFVHSIYKLKKEVNESNINYIKNQAIKCGSIGIKLLQVFVMNNFFNTNALNFVLESCPQHDFSYTEKIYKKQYNKNINDTYTLKKVIGTGSIGQVYKLWDKENERFVAMKVKHPDVDKKVLQFNWIVKLLKFLFRIDILNMVAEYTENIKKQLDYGIEAENTIKIKDNFKNEKSLIVPEIYSYTQDIIIMEYQDGTHFDDIDNSLKTKVSLYINYLLITSILIHDFVHSDLHTGNWKVKCENDTFKIVLYDCGLVCSTGDAQMNRKIVKYTLNNNYRKLLNCILYKHIQNKPKKYIKKIYSKIDTCVYECNLSPDISSKERLEIFLKNAMNSGLLNHNKNVLHVLNAYVLVNRIASIGVNSLANYVYIKKDNSVAIIMSIHIGMLKKLKVFDDLFEYFKQWVKKNTANDFIYRSWLLNEFGHDDSDIFINTIYDLI
jgi:predicted unusual protein kinase regulating ubiquinone biosynthesis (AarF/ABC1/UbiB family)